MQRIPIAGGWYCFATIEGDGGVLIPNQHIQTSRGIIPLPLPGDNVLYLVGATHSSGLVMAGQSHGGKGCWFYRRGEWKNPGVCFGVSPCAFSQDGQYLYVAESATTGYYVNVDTDERTNFSLPFYTDGIRAVIPPTNKVILGNVTQYDPVSQLHQYINFENGLVVGQSDGPIGLVCAAFDERFLIEPGGTYFIRAQYDGNKIALATVKQEENQAVLWYLTKDELWQFPHDEDIVIPVIGKDCWCAWFEFNQPAPTAPPGNAFITVRWPTQHHTIIKTDGSQFANFCAAEPGEGIDDIERKVAASQYPALAYWDDRNWPRWPILREGDWINIFGYCPKDETPNVFEANMRAMLNAVPAQYKQISINPQVYTSNDKYTKNLKGIIPVYARLARDYPRVNFLANFSDQNRATGLNDHPELRPYWQRLFEGITGEPPVSNGFDYGAANAYGVRRWAELRVNEISAEMEQAGQEFRGFQRACFVQVMQELHWQENYRWVELFWKGGIGNIAGIGEDTFVARHDANTVKWCDAVVSMGTTHSSWNSLVVDNDPNPPSDEDLCAPPPPLTPTPGNIAIQVRSYTNPARRSDPDGCEVKFEIAADNQVVEIKIEVNDGDLPFLWTWTPGTKDGRYYRILGFKVTVEGDWTLRITAKDRVGNVAVWEGPIKVIA